MLFASSWPPIATASNRICRAKPSATPMMICWIVTITPPTENTVMSVGCGTSGATRYATAPASTRRMRAGMKSAPNAGATMKHAPMRTNGQNNWLIHPSSWACVTVIIGGLRRRRERSSVDEHRDAFEQLARVADEQPQHPGAGDHERDRRGDELRDERQRHFIDLSCGLKGADHESGHERDEQQRRGQHQRHFQGAVAHGHHHLGGHW